MIHVHFEYHMPVCEGCGKHLPAEKDDAAAEAAMRADGWIKVDGKDTCPLCQQKIKETGNYPDRRFYRRNVT